MKAKNTPDHACHLFERYVYARDFIINNGYEPEIFWQATRDISSIKEQDFLEESAWVILNSGMRESVVRSKFGPIKKAFFNFESAKQIIEHENDCRKRALKAFNHEKKISAIVNVAGRIVSEGFDSVRHATVTDGLTYLQTFDFIGPITCRHLAKNLGLPIAKPDRHLKRVASATGFHSVSELCCELSSLSGDAVPVVDLVIWRFATLVPNYRSWFQAPTLNPVSN